MNAPKNITQPKIMVIASIPERMVFSLRCVRISFSVLEMRASNLIGSKADFTSDSLSFNDLKLYTVRCDSRVWIFRTRRFTY